MTTIETIAQGDYTIKIDVDYDVDSPHDTDVPAAKLVLDGGRHYTFPNDAGIDFRDFEGWAGVADELAKRHGAILVTPVWVFDHSGIALKAGARTYPFNCQWDSAQVGFAYITQETYQAVTGKRYVGRPSQYKRASELIATEVEYYGRYVNGECYAYVVEDAEGEVVDSCGGYIGYEAVTTAATEYIDSI
jgi:hypothetical protein